MGARTEYCGKLFGYNHLDYPYNAVYKEKAEVKTAKHSQNELTNSGKRMSLVVPNLKWNEQNFEFSLLFLFHPGNNNRDQRPGSLE